MAAPEFNGTDHNPILCQLIADRIADTPQQQITFAEYMDLVLYHPQHGYYATNQAKIGVKGDFFTSPHLGADFGELLAEQFVQLWELLDRPVPFTLVEMGAGQGLLAQDVVRYLHRHYFECFAALHYIIIETSPTFIAEQQQRLAKIPYLNDRLQWLSWNDIPSNSIVGCCFSNELVDAFPVHQIVVEAGQLREVYVTTAPERDVKASLPQFVERIDQLSTPELNAYFDFIDVPITSNAYVDGFRSEVNLAALKWMSTVADRLQRGYVLTIDYGYPAHRYYTPARPQGTLQCYYHHAYHSDPYLNVGRQDLTAHVDFTALERQGERCGLHTIGFTQQGLFLMALGLGDRLAALAESDANQPLQEVLRRREALHSLMSPLGLGNFGVLVQCKNVGEIGRSLKGLTVPPFS